MVSRPDSWWPEVFWVTEAGRALFDVVHEDATGRADGYVSYEIKGEWYGGFADRELYVWDLQAVNPIARAALWEFVFGVDLVAKILATNLPADEPLRFLLADRRQLRTDFFIDSVWVLAARRRGTARGAHVLDVRASSTIEVVDPDGSRSQFLARRRARRRELPRAVDRVRCPTSRARRSTLGALLARRHLVGDPRGGRRSRRAHRPAPSPRADAMFATAPDPGDD